MQYSQRKGRCPGPRARRDRACAPPKKPFPCPLRRLAAPPPGILSAAVDYGFVNHTQFITYGKEFAARCRAKNNCAGTLGDEVVRIADKIMPADAAKRIEGLAYITLSTPKGRVGVPEGDFVDRYASRQGALRARRAAPCPRRGRRAAGGGSCAAGLEARACSACRHQTKPASRARPHHNTVPPSS